MARWKCRDCNEDVKTTPEEDMLYNELRRNDVLHLRRQYCDGHKHIDIFDEEVGVAIEVDGLQHFKSKQALADLKRAFWSFKKDGILTVHLSNELIRAHLKETAKYVADFLDAAYEFNADSPFWSENKESAGVFINDDGEVIDEDDDEDIEMPWG